mmetsp:Transcript_47970/g.104363  ORF Transcript_47970/g.104363 Transcript_47970/m.104363 type:complete len:366 (-) Transcript_47970:29-1126(-)
MLQAPMAWICSAFLLAFLISTVAAEEAFSDAAMCDVESTGAFCFAGQGKLLPGAKQRGLIGHWSFDAESAVDSSGHGNHGIIDLLEHGPSPAGKGHSALFRSNFVMVPHSERLDFRGDYTFSFWVFIPEEVSDPSDDRAGWCPILRKGIFETSVQEISNAPVLLYRYQTGQLRAAISTTASVNQSSPEGETLDSNARVVPDRWMHVALVRRGAHLLLYVNGILDATIPLKGEALPNNYPLYIGGDPFTADRCSRSLYIDDLRAYSRAVAPHDLQAEAAPALGGADPALVRLGCIGCSIREAANSCPKTRHLCTSLELHTGGYQVARALGWLAGGMHVWSEHAVSAKATLGMPTSGLGLCCDGAAS